MRLSLFVALILTLITISPAYAATYYAAPNGSGNGSESQPSSLTEAIQQLSSGDTLILRGGIYPKSRINLQNKSNLTIKNYPGEWPIIDGGWANQQQHPAWCNNSSVSVTESNQGLLSILNSDHISVLGLELRDSAGRGIVVGNSQHVDLANTKVDGTFAHGVAIVESQQVTYRDSELTRSGGQRNFYGGSNPCTGETYSNWPYVTHAVNSDYIYYLRNYIHDNKGEGPSAFKSRNVWIDSNISANNSANLIYVNHSQDTTIRNNIGYMTDDYDPSDRNRVSGLPFRDETESEGRDGGDRSRHVQVYNNLFIGAGKTLTLSEGLNLIDTEIHHNSFILSRERHVVYQAAGSGYIRQNSSVHHNLFYGPATSSGTRESGVTWSANAWTQAPPAAIRSQSDIVGDITLNDPTTIATSNRDLVEIANYLPRQDNLNGAGINDAEALQSTLNLAGIKTLDWDGTAPQPGLTPAQNPTATPTTPDSQTLTVLDWLTSFLSQRLPLTSIKY